MLTNIHRQKDGSYVLKKEGRGEGEGDDDSDVEAEAAMMKCGPSSAACDL